MNLINNVLDISKIEAGHMVREDSNINLEQLLRELESLISIKIIEKGHKFDIMLSPDLPGDITVDPGKLRQILSQNGYDVYEAEKGKMLSIFLTGKGTASHSFQ